MRCCVKEVDSLFHPKVRWGEDSIFNAPAGIGGKACPAGGIKGVYGLYQANGANGNQILLVSGHSVIFFNDVRHQPQIVPDEPFPCGGIPGPQRSKGGCFFPGCEWARETAAFQVERQEQKLCGEKLQQGQQHTGILRSLQRTKCVTANVCARAWTLSDESRKWMQGFFNVFSCRPEREFYGASLFIK